MSLFLVVKDNYLVMTRVEVNLPIAAASIAVPSILITVFRLETLTRVDILSFSQ